MEALHYYNGKYLKKNEISISPDDVGFTRAHAVFEFFRVEANVPIFLNDHLDRLERSADGLHISLPIKRSEIIEVVHDLIKRNDMQSSAIKIMLTGGVSSNGFSPGQPTFLIMQLPFQKLDQAIYEKGASIMSFEYQRDLPHLKSVEYAQALALEHEWKRKGHIDVLYHFNSMVYEVSRSSIFIVNDGRIKTNEEGVLAGVTQKNVLRAIEGKFETSIGAIGLNEFLQSDEVFITSTSKRVLPIIKVDDKIIGLGVPGEITKEVGRLLDGFIQRQQSLS